jgi:hypothetical protein
MATTIAEYAVLFGGVRNRGMAESRRKWSVKYVTQYDVSETISCAQCYSTSYEYNAHAIEYISTLPYSVVTAIGAPVEAVVSLWRFCLARILTVCLESSGSQAVDEVLEHASNEIF